MAHDEHNTRHQTRPPPLQDISLGYGSRISEFFDLGPNRNKTATKSVKLPLVDAPNKDKYPSLPWTE